MWVALTLRGVRISKPSAFVHSATTLPRPAYAIKKTSLGIRQQRIYRRQIGPVIDEVSAVVRSSGKTASRRAGWRTLHCASSLRGVNNCYGAASFHSSPTEGDAGYRNYTLRADGNFGERIYVDQHSNDAEIYIPTRHTSRCHRSQ